MDSLGFFRRRIVDPVFKLLKAGLSPRDLARALAVGCILGTIPILGISAALCSVVAHFLRLNQVAVQVSNYAVYPLQFLLLIPFFRLGEIIWRDPPVSLNLEYMLDAFKNSPTEFILEYAMTGIHGFTAWALVSIPAYLLLRQSFEWLLERTKLKR